MNGLWVGRRGTAGSTWLAGDAARPAWSRFLRAGSELSRAVSDAARACSEARALVAESRAMSQQLADVPPEAPLDAASAVDGVDGFALQAYRAYLMTRHYAEEQHRERARMTEPE